MPNYKCEKFRPDTLNASGQCVIRLCGMLSDEEAWQEKWHDHQDACELLLVVQGRGEVCVDQKWYCMMPGDLLIYNEGVTHAERLLSVDEPARLFYVVLGDVWIHGLPPNVLVPPGMSPVLHTGEAFSDLSCLMSMIYGECTHQDQGYQRVAQGLAQALLTMATRLANDRYQLMLSGSSMSLANQIREYIESHCAEELTLKKIAGHFYISHCYLDHLFKQHHGTSVIGYLIRFRMNRARFLLETTEIPIKQIASSLGYANPAYFSLAFKKAEGLPPAEYRMRHCLEK